MKKMFCFVLVLIMLTSTLVIVSATSNEYQNNIRFHEASKTELNNKYNSGEKFIWFGYRTTCSNSQGFGTSVLTEIMDDYNIDVYGLDVDDYGIPSWCGVSGSITLPLVGFVNNKSVTTFTASNGYNTLVNNVKDKLKSEYKIDLDSDLDEYSYTVTYHQTEARSMLSRVNYVRANDAWYYNTDGSVLNFGSLGALTYDYDLEISAMQRAAELVVRYAHERPDGSRCFTSYSSYSMAGENIAYGHRTADIVQEAWEEADCNYDGQGHRRNMLNNSFTAVAFACAEYNGVKCWVQEFRKPVVSTQKTPATDNSKKVSVIIDPDLLTTKEISVSKNSLNLEYGSYSSLPTVNINIATAQTPRRMKIAAEVACKWSSTNQSIVTVSNNQIKAVGVGTAKLKCTAAGTDFYVNVTVTSKSLSGAKITLESDRVEYTGVAANGKIKSVVLNGITLDSKDYTYTCSSNTVPGTAKLVITGNGNYYGTASTTYTIYCLHKQAVNDNAIAPDCTNYGLTAGTHCKLCNEPIVRQQVIPALGHNDTDNDGICNVCNRIANLKRYNELMVKNSEIEVTESADVTWKLRVNTVAEGKNIPENYHIAWFDGDEMVSNSEILQTPAITRNVVYTAKIVDKDGNIASDESQNKTLTITVMSSFFVRIMSFFIRLFLGDTIIV